MAKANSETRRVLRARLASMGWFALRYKPLLLLTLLCLCLGEQFPFSDFPMYSSFTNKTFYVYLADGAGQPLPASASTGLRTSQLKKIYQRELRKEEPPPGRPRPALTLEQKRSAGNRVLASLKQSQWVRKRSKLPSALRFYEVNISFRDGRFEKQPLLVGELG